MKTKHVGAGAASVLIIAALLLNGCGQGGGTSAPPQTSPPPAAVPSAEKNSFKEVTAHLEPGGNFYLYLSTEQWLDNLSGKFADWRGVFQGLPGKPDDQQRVLQVFDLVTNLVKHSGVEEISGFGMSSIARDKGLYRTTSILHHYPGNDSGYMWSAFGRKPHALDGLNLLPDNTALAVFSDLDAPYVWSAVQKEADDSGVPEVQAWVQSAPDLFANATGLKLKDVLDSLGGEYGVVLTLDDGHMVAVPLPGQAMQVPEPALMLVFKVKNDVIFDAVDAKLKGNVQVIISETNGIRMRTMPVPLPLPISVRPTIARSGDYLFVASTDSIIKAAVAVSQGKQPGLKSSDEFKRLAQGVPEQGNQFSFVSQRFGQVLQEVQGQSLQAASARETPTQAAAMTKLMNFAGPPASAYAVCANGDDGWLSIGNGTQDPSKVALLVPVAAMGAMAAIAVPNFVRAREAAQRTACINNLKLIDGAKQVWALEHKKMATDVPTWDDIRSYLDPGPLGKILTCPEGGTYAINAVGVPPTCSIPGHVLP